MQAILIFFNSRSTSCRKFWTVRLSLALVGLRSELTVHLPPSEPLRSAQGEGAIDQPQVEIESQRRAFEGCEGVNVERHRVADNFVEKILAEFDLALP